MMQPRVDGATSPYTFIFAHGAGAGMDHAFMSTMTELLVQRGIKVVRFNFPYMVLREQDGRKRPPDRAPKLLEAYREVIAEYAQQGPIVIGGKSMGGRMASLLADQQRVLAIACLGYPFHPPGKLDKYKGEHLADIAKPTLILQGERDTFGRREEVADYPLSSHVEVKYLTDGDHSFTPRKRAAVSEEDNLIQAAQWLSHFIKKHYDEQQ